MAVVNKHAFYYVAALAKAELVVRPIVRRLGLELRNNVMLIFADYYRSSETLQYIDGKEQEVAELGRALAYAFLLGEEAVKKQYTKQSVALSISYDKYRGAYGDVTFADTTKLAAFYNSEAIKIAANLNEQANKLIRIVILNGIKNNSTQKQVTRNLQLAFNRLGITGQSKYSIARIARTQTQLAFSAGKYSFEQRPEVSSALWGYTYFTVGDDKVRAEHELIDGVSLPKTNPFWDSNYPPNGWNCRCQVIAEFEPQKIVLPPKLYLGPDKGFNFNPGKVFRAIL